MSMYVHMYVPHVVDPGQRDFPRLKSEWKFANRPATSPSPSVPFFFFLNMSRLRIFHQELLEILDLFPVVSLSRFTGSY